MVHARKKQALLSSPTCIGAQVQVALGQRLDLLLLENMGGGLTGGWGSAQTRRHWGDNSS